jgi:hypothetical protein
MYRTMKLSSSTVNLTMKESLKPTQRAQKQTFRWMLKATIYNCSQKLRLQEKVSEPGTVDANVTPARQKHMVRTWCPVFLFLRYQPGVTFSETTNRFLHAKEEQPKNP